MGGGQGEDFGTEALMEIVVLPSGRIGHSGSFQSVSRNTRRALGVLFLQELEVAYEYGRIKSNNWFNRVVSRYLAQLHDDQNARAQLP
jgi:hypothetical protein